MWLDCENVIINLDHVDYVQFDQQNENAKATVYFDSGGELSFTHSDINILKKHFRRVVEVKKDDR